MTTDQLAAELERAYWAEDTRRVSCGEAVNAEHAAAANAHLPVLARQTARAGARWARRARRPRRTDPGVIVDEVVHEAQKAPECKSILGVVGLLVLRSILENLAWRLIMWRFSDSTDDRDELLCKMGET